MRLFLLVFFLFVITGNLYANDGVYVSGNTPQAQQNRDKQFEELVEKMVINTILADTGEVVTQFMKKQNINLFPQVAYNTIQMIAVQVFQQEALKSFPQDAYKDALDKIDELKAKNVPVSQMQSEVTEVIDGILKPIREEFVYQEVCKLAIQEGMKKNQQIMIMAYAQKQQQLVMMQQQQIYMQQMVQQYYQQAIQQAMTRQMQAVQNQRTQALRNAEVQYQQVQQEYYKQQKILESQYEQEMRRRAILEQQRLRQ